MPNDPKWRTVARVSKQPITAVIAVYIHLLVAASNATERGRTQSASIEDIASALDMESEQIEQIMSAMQGRVLDEDRISGWDKRQVEREDGSAARAKAWRESKKTGDKTHSERDRTHSERKQTPDKDKDKDKELTTPIPPDGGKVSKKSSAISLRTYLDECKAASVKSIPETDPVFDYAAKIGLPDEFLRLQWLEFRERYTLPDAKRYKAWTTVFRKSVQGNWFKLWYCDSEGKYLLTTVGQQADKNHKEAA